MNSHHTKALRRRVLIAGLAATITTTASLAQEIVNIGYTGPLSGGAALYGKNVVDGITMAINEINASGLQVNGKDVQFRLIALDDKYSPAEAAVNARRLVQQSRVAAIFVPHSGGIFALQTFNEQEQFIVMAYASLPRIIEQGNSLTVRIPPSITTYIEPFSRYQQNRFGKKVGLLPADHDYAKTWTQLFRQGWTQLGGEVVADNPMSYNKSADFYSGVSRVLAAKPDVLFIGGPSEPTGLVARQARELGFKGGFLIMDQAKLDEMARVTDGLAMLEGSVGVMPLSIYEREASKAFVADFAKVYGADRIATTESSYNYTFTHVLAGAMKLANTTSDARAIYAKMDEAVKALAPLTNTGEFSGIDANGGTMSTMDAVVVENGAYTAISLRALMQLGQ